jgi:hypothetical protein
LNVERSYSFPFESDRTPEIDVIGSPAMDGLVPRVRRRLSRSRGGMRPATVSSEQTTLGGEDVRGGDVRVSPHGRERPSDRLFVRRCQSRSAVATNDLGQGGQILDQTLAQGTRFVDCRYGSGEEENQATGDRDDRRQHAPNAQVAEGSHQSCFADPPETIRPASFERSDLIQIPPSAALSGRPPGQGES